MGTRRTTSTPTTKPVAPTRQWWQYIPGLGQGFNDQMAEYQNSYNEWMWNKQNEWNLPKNQMDRYREAGLSANLMYGQGSPGNAEQAKTAEKPETVQGVMPGNILNRVVDTKMKVAQINNMDADTRIKKVTAALGQGELSAKELNLDSPILKTKDPSRYLTVRQNTEWQKMLKAVQDAKTAKEQAIAAQKMNNWFIAKMLTGMGSMGLGTIARFK